MKFKVVSQGGILVSEGLDKSADIVRLREGHPESKQKKPLDLAKGESTRCEFPLEKRKATYVITRTE